MLRSRPFGNKLFDLKCVIERFLTERVSIISRKVPSKAQFIRKSVYKRLGVMFQMLITAGLGIPGTRDEPSTSRNAFVSKRW